MLLSQSVVSKDMLCSGFIEQELWLIQNLRNVLKIFVLQGQNTLSGDFVFKCIIIIIHH